MKHTLYLTKSVKDFSPNKIELSKKFIQFCCDELGIDTDSKVFFTEKRGGHITTTASYNPDNHDIWIWIKNRHLCDILRSLAHEYRHMRQGLDNVLGPDSGKTDSIHEREANIFSGNIMRAFGKKYPELFDV